MLFTDQRSWIIQVCRHDRCVYNMRYASFHSSVDSCLVLRKSLSGSRRADHQHGLRSGKSLCKLRYRVIEGAFADEEAFRRILGKLARVSGKQHDGGWRDAFL